MLLGLTEIDLVLLALLVELVCTPLLAKAEELQKIFSKAKQDEIVSNYLWVAKVGVHWPFCLLAADSDFGPC